MFNLDSSLLTVYSNCSAILARASSKSSAIIIVELNILNYMEVLLASRFIMQESIGSGSFGYIVKGILLWFSFSQVLILRRTRLSLSNLYSQ